MHQDGFILVFRDVLYDGHPPSVGPRGGIPPLGVVMMIVGRELSKTLFFPGPLTFCKKAVERVNSEKIF